MDTLATIRKFLNPPHKPLDGSVTFNEIKFVVAPPNSRELEWFAIERILAYKNDLLTFDEIRVQFNHSGGSIVVTEESSGFAEFMQEVVRRFPTAADWHAKVSQPAFAASETVLYEKVRT